MPAFILTNLFPHFLLHYNQAEIIYSTFAVFQAKAVHISSKENYNFIVLSYFTLTGINFSKKKSFFQIYNIEFTAIYTTESFSRKILSTLFANVFVT